MVVVDSPQEKEEYFIMRRIIVFTFLLSSIVFYASISLSEQSNILSITPVAQSTQIKNLCAPTAAAMITKYYGRSDLDQYAIGKGVCEMVAAHKKKYPKTNPIPCTWPNYPETYQPILANFLRKYGFKVRTTRTAYDKSSGNIHKKRQEEFMELVRDGIPVIVHVERHYFLVIGYDESRKVIIFNDPAGGVKKEVTYSSFFNRYNPWYKGRQGWDGRYLAVWRG